MTEPLKEREKQLKWMAVVVEEVKQRKEEKKDHNNNNFDFIFLSFFQGLLGLRNTKWQIAPLRESITRGYTCQDSHKSQTFCHKSDKDHHLYGQHFFLPIDNIRSSCLISTGSKGSGFVRIQRENKACIT